MIVPILNGIYKFSKAPVTWLLFCMNLILFVLFTGHQELYKREFDHLMKNDQFILSQGSMFASYVLNHKENHTEFLVKMSEAGLAGKKSQLEVLGQMSIRHRDFMEYALEIKPETDEVEYAFWRENFLKLKNLHERDISHLLGYYQSSYEVSFMSAVTYQFVHGGALHLISNMWFLMIFGTFMEVLVGSLGFLIFYLLAGIGSALFFSFLSGDSAIPLVGASGSISGIMGLYLAMFWYQSTRCMFWLLPIRGYTGFVEIPTWAVIGIWFISDLTGYLGNLREMGGVAHTAHIGGLLIGIVVGLAFAWGKPSTQSILNDASGF